MPDIADLVLYGCIGYGLLIAIILSALGRVRTGHSAGIPGISVVVAARNEEEHIRTCLAALRNQDYPADSYEVIVADDRSTDGTPAALDEIRAVWPSLRTIRIDSTPKGISPKKNALAAAIATARGEIILQTDADCAVPKGWISGMARRFEPGVGFVAGIAPYRKAPGMLNSFVRHEYLWNAALSASSIALGHGTHASGRNMGFRRDTFDRLNGYGESMAVLSGDDTLLLQRMVRSGGTRAATMPDISTHVPTSAPSRLRDLLRQRTRHMSTGRYFDPSHIALGALTYGLHALLLLTIVLSPFRRDLILPALAGFLWKAGADALVAAKVRSTLGLTPEWRMFPVNELLLLVYMTLFPVAGLVVPVRWKDAPQTMPRV